MEHSKLFLEREERAKNYTCLNSDELLQFLFVQKSHFFVYIEHYPVNLTKNIKASTAFSLNYYCKERFFTGIPPLKISVAK